MVHIGTFIEVGLSQFYIEYSFFQIFMCGHVIIIYHRNTFVLYLKDVQTNESIC